MKRFFLSIALLALGCPEIARARCGYLYRPLSQAFAKLDRTRPADQFHGVRLSQYPRSIQSIPLELQPAYTSYLKRNAPVMVQYAHNLLRRASERAKRGEKVSLVFLEEGGSLAYETALLILRNQRSLPVDQRYSLLEKDLIMVPYGMDQLRADTPVETAQTLANYFKNEGVAKDHTLLFAGVGGDGSVMDFPISGRIPISVLKELPGALFTALGGKPKLEGHYVVVNMQDRDNSRISTPFLQVHGLVFDQHRFAVMADWLKEPANQYALNQLLRELSPRRTSPLPPLPTSGMRREDYRPRFRKTPGQAATTHDDAVALAIQTLILEPTAGRHLPAGDYGEPTFSIDRVTDLWNAFRPLQSKTP